MRCRTEERWMERGREKRRKLQNRRKGDGRRGR
jgi:hypothetical protein